MLSRRELGLLRGLAVSMPLCSPVFAMSGSHL
jgi:hypothetical protein